MEICAPALVVAAAADDDGMCVCVCVTDGRRIHFAAVNAVKAMSRRSTDSPPPDWYITLTDRQYDLLKQVTFSFCVCVCQTVTQTVHGSRCAYSDTRPIL